MRHVINHWLPKYQLNFHSTLFLFNAPTKTFRVDDGAFVQAADDDFVVVAGFDLELELGAIHVFDVYIPR